MIKKEDILINKHTGNIYVVDRIGEGEKGPTIYIKRRDHISQAGMTSFNLGALEDNFCLRLNPEEDEVEEEVEEVLWGV
jgi:hypothetical protein